MRDVSHPALTASPGSANPVLHRFCHPTLFVGQMGRSQAVRRHVLKARGSLLSTLLTKHTSPLGPTTRHVTRTKIKALWEQGMTQRAIAKSVGCGIATVARWVHKFKEAKHAGIPDNIAVVDEPRAGAPTKLTNSIGKAIVKFTESKRSRQLSAIRTHVQRRFGVVLTRMRIEQYLSAQGLKPFRPQKQPLLLPQQKKKRVKFAKKHLNHDWRMTLFTDETELSSSPQNDQQTKQRCLGEAARGRTAFGGEAVFCESAGLGWSLCAGQHALTNLRRRPDGAQVSCTSEESKTEFRFDIWLAQS